MSYLRIPLAMLAAVTCFVFVKPASANVIGSLDVANCAGGGVSFSELSISWLPTGSQAGTGCIDTGAGTNLTYSGGTLGTGVVGDIMNLTAGGGSVDQFMTFQGTTLDFVLTGLGPGSANTNCAGLTIGQSCSASAGSPFVLTNLGAITLVSFTANGTIDDGGVTGLWSGGFTTQALATTAAIQSTLLAGGTVSSTYSGQFDVTSSPSVTEPSTISMLVAGAGLLLFGLKPRRA